MTDDPIMSDPETARRVAAAIERLARDWRHPPELEELAADAGFSPGHFQRIFKRWVGISPKRFAQFVTLGHARRLLREDGVGLLDAALDLGLSGPSRLHDLFVVAEAVTPGEFKTSGEGLEIRFGFHDTPLGRVLMAATPRGLCWLSFVGDKDETRNLEELRRDWPQARLIEDPAANAATAARIFLGGDRPEPLTLHLRGTNFQVKVWQALLDIPFGQVRTYEAVARTVGQPSASRAVGNAVGANRISFLVPCHRVIRKTGVLDNYRWGPARKRALLAWEAARLAAD